MDDWWSLENKHKEKRTYILANGPSLTTHPLSRLSEPTIGINRSFHAHLSTYHVALEYLQMEYNGGLENAKYIFSTHQRCNKDMEAVRLRDLAGVGWSWNIKQGIYPRFTVYAALQIAVWMGFDEIVMLGLDLTKEPGINAYQRELLGYAAGILRDNVTVLDCSESDLRVWPKVKFKDVV